MNQNHYSSQSSSVTVALEYKHYGTKAYSRADESFCQKRISLDALI
jgi:hypothetical protein